jgi:mRNA-capping enzyme
MTFLERKDETRHLSGTLLDGEMVIDEDPVTNRMIPRYLVYDIITIHKDGKDQLVGQIDFNTRMLCIEREIEGARNNYILEGKINKANEPFSIRQKKFWDLQGTKKLLGPQFTKKELGHEPDGLIFQPVNHVSACKQTLLSLFCDRCHV